ncbi:MAG: hypothetical protein ACI849_000398, partial [Patiriisocius sp.]
MKKLDSFNLLLLGAFLLLPFTNVFSQGPGCPNVDAGADATINCASGGCVDITATFLETGETTSYDVSPIPYAPFPFIGGIPVSVDIDDVWSDPIDLPFNFCFFGDSYDEIIIGSNAVVSFDLVTNTPGGFCDWSFDESIPDPALFRATIFGPYMDVNPAPSPPTSDMNYQVLGDAPCRTMVISFPNIFYFGCPTLRMTSQIVIYETTNVVEVYVLDRPSGCGWNDGNAVIGIQDGAGTLGYTPPGRNTGDWDANSEAWRFTPNGPSNVTFDWLDSAGTVVGNTTILNVCPSATETYTARASYLNCDGVITVVTDDVVITTSNPFTVDLGPDQASCTPDPIILTADTAGTPGLSYEWFFNTISQGPSTIGDDMFTVNSPNTGAYTVEVFDPADTTCVLIDEVIINFNNQPIANQPNDLFQCDDGVNTGIFDLTVNDAVVLGAQDPADFVITYHNTAFDAGTGAAPIATPLAYAITGVTEEIFVRIESIEEEDVFLEDFGTGLGRVSHPFTPLLFNPITQLNPNDYAVTNISTGLNVGWHQGMEDNTVGDTDGRTIFLDISDNPTQIELYRRDVTVTANTNHVFDFAMTTVYDTGTNICPNNGLESRVIYQIEDALGTVLGTSTTGTVPNGANPNWINYSLDFNSGANTTIQIVLLNDIFGVCGNDIALDDIRIRSEGVCFATESFFLNFSPISVDLGLDQDTCAS